ncbi:hypothetical protein GNY06_06900 [Elizabethkingia argentiflava]|uniref:Lipoprotein n=1 Tax=Elizabethkingia argenteiflava TaxID=2681556 RepID=A0A845PVW5_9FLAO|nr:hypothetical protein [Elizabethkingia argenteiflava]NAW51111.1 hypothetical protein [Elizabethkingia argenteiflava]
MKRALLILILSLFIGCGSRHKTSALNLEKKSEDVDLKSDGLSSAKIDRKEWDIHQNTQGKLSFKVLPAPQHSASPLSESKNLPRKLKVKDVLGNEVEYHLKGNEVVVLNAENKQSSTIRNMQEKYKRLEKEKTELKQKLGTYTKQKSKEVKSSRPMWSWYALFFFVGMVTMPLMRLLKKSIP